MHLMIKGNMKNLLLSIVISALLTGCSVGGAITQVSTVSQPLQTLRTVGVGDTVMTVDTTKSLPNAFGKADIFGRTTPAGKTTITFEGIKDGRIVLVRKDIAIETGATTMNSTAMVLPNTTTTTHTGRVGGTNYYGTSISQGTSTVIMPNTPSPSFIDGGERVIILDINKLPTSTIIADHILKINSATQSTLTYVIEKQNQQ